LSISDLRLQISDLRFQIAELRGKVQGTRFGKMNSVESFETGKKRPHPPLSKGQKEKFSPNRPEALLPLKKGGREGFLGGLLKKLKDCQIVIDKLRASS
jgi:hypothetical protein